MFREALVFYNQKDSNNLYLAALVIFFQHGHQIVCA